MKIALCDDDEKELSNIRSLLDSYQKTHNISVYLSRISQQL